MSSSSSSTTSSSSKVSRFQGANNTHRNIRVNTGHREFALVHCGICKFFHPSNMTLRDVAMWSCVEVHDFLRQLCTFEIPNAVIDEGFNGQALLDANHEILKALGIEKVGHRQIVIGVIRQLKKCHISKLKGMELKNKDRFYCKVYSLYGNEVRVEIRPGEVLSYGHVLARVVEALKVICDETTAEDKSSSSREICNNYRLYLVPHGVHPRDAISVCPSLSERELLYLLTRGLGGLDDCCRLRKIYISRKRSHKSSSSSKSSKSNAASGDACTPSSENGGSPLTSPYSAEIRRPSNLRQTTTSSSTKTSPLSVSPPTSVNESTSKAAALTNSGNAMLKGTLLKSPTALINLPPRTIMPSSSGRMSPKSPLSNEINNHHLELLEKVSEKRFTLSAVESKILKRSSFLSRPTMQQISREMSRYFPRLLLPRQSIAVTQEEEPASEIDESWIVSPSGNELKKELPAPERASVVKRQSLTGFFRSKTPEAATPAPLPQYPMSAGSHSPLLLPRRNNELRLATEMKRRSKSVDESIYRSLKDLAKHFKPKKVNSYTVGKELGRGSYGVVYLSMDTNTKEIMAMKQVSLKGYNFNEEKRGKIDKVRSVVVEVETLKKLSHPHVVRYIDSSFDEENISIFLEYIDGGTLKGLIEDLGRLSEEMIRTFTYQVLNGLKYIHSQRIIHRDIKASNILLTSEGKVKITDFGIAKDTRDAEIQNRASSVKGTTFWLCPETLSPGRVLTSKVDIWGVGCTILEMLTNDHPWAFNQNISVTAAVYKIGHRQRPQLSPEINTSISDELRILIDDCFEVYPERRPDAETLMRYPFIQNGSIVPFEE